MTQPSFAAVHALVDIRQLVLDVVHAVLRPAVALPHLVGEASVTSRGRPASQSANLSLDAHEQVVPLVVHPRREISDFRPVVKDLASEHGADRDGDDNPRGDDRSDDQPVSALIPLLVESAGGVTFAPPSP